jgi:chemotaxis family two-component system sensor kinase Cph1
VTHDPLPSVCCDDTQIAQVFQNLVGNAIKYRTEAPPRIHIWAEAGEQEWVISVRDNGMGIDPQYHERIFGIFKRLHGRELPGTGMGLAICKRIIERHNGRIWVESQAGEGSTFRFSLPS